ncbi:hypothetical protein [uncultured Parabacteroides sp.]|uniref:hypothetical protein n=1 Tax=uncultured Parabacteroides sp. TaxID=512312 RepID=UPI0025FD07E1|nr:hypothetical protein [uncultured Parabacteroides sp.]
MKTKHVSIFFCLCILLMGCGSSKKQGNSIPSNGELRKELKQSAVKQARKEAKLYKKEGFKTFIGGMPLDKQIESAWTKSVASNESGLPEYIVVNARVIGGNASSAKMQATHQAKVELAGLMSSNISSLIENSVSNNELSNEEAIAINKAVQASKELIIADLGRVTKEIEIYRDLNNKNVEVMVCLSYSSKAAADIAVQNIHKNLEQEAENLHDKLDSLIGIKQIISTNNTNLQKE